MLNQWNLVQIEINKSGKIKVFIDDKSVSNFEKEPHYSILKDNFNRFNTGSLNGQGDYFSVYVKLTENNVETIIRNLIKQARLRLKLKS